jgi:glycosyltransferase involved in cell wall biosynthesis
MSDENEQALTRPRIGIDVTAAVNQGAGIGRYTRELVNALASEDEENAFEYTLFSAKIPKKIPVENPLPTGTNISVRLAPINERWLYRLWYKLNIPIPIQVFTGSLDLFHSTDFVLPPVQQEIPTLLTIHDLSFIHYPETFTSQLRNYLNKVVPRSVSRATHILADSKATKHDIAAIWGVAPDKITVLYSGVSPHFQPTNDQKSVEELRARYNLGTKPYLLCVGTVQPRKNYQMLIRAFYEVAQQFPHNLIIAGGKGWLYDQILAEIEEQDLNDRVRFIGFVDEHHLPALYSEASLFLFPSVYEGFGLPLLEAMACGVSVVSSNASSLPEVVGDAGMILPPNDTARWTETMIKLLGDSKPRTALIAKGFLQARKFSWNEAAQKLQQIYRHLLKI